MNKLVKMATGCAAVSAVSFGVFLGSTIVLVNSPVAHADEMSFVQDLNDNGFSNSTEGYKGEVAVGMGICEKLLEGDTNYHQAEVLYENSKLTSIASAEQFVHIAVRDLCP